jgi:hypothetical protein
MRRILLLPFAILLLSARARAEAPTGDAGAPPRPFELDTSALLVLPQADADDYTEESLGGRVALAYAFSPYVSAMGSIEYVRANTKEDLVPDYYRIYFYSIDVGARFSLPQPGGVRPFAELLIGRHTAGYDSDSGDDTSSDFGYRLGAGLFYPVSAAIDAVGQVSYTSAEIEDADIDALVLEGGLGFRL